MCKFGRDLSGFKYVKNNVILISRNQSGKCPDSFLSRHFEDIAVQAHEMMAAQINFCVSAGRSNFLSYVIALCRLLTHFTVCYLCKACGHTMHLF